MFKRNQIEEAIVKVLGAGSGTVNSEISTRLKRLLETDRSFGRNQRPQIRNAQILRFTAGMHRGAGTRTGSPDTRPLPF